MPCVVWPCLTVCIKTNSTHTHKHSVRFLSLSYILFCSTYWGDTGILRRHSTYSSAIVSSTPLSLITSHKLPIQGDRYGARDILETHQLGWTPEKDRQGQEWKKHKINYPSLEKKHNLMIFFLLIYPLENTSIVRGFMGFISAYFQPNLKNVKPGSPDNPLNAPILRLKFSTHLSKRKEKTLALSLFTCVYKESELCVYNNDANCQSTNVQIRVQPGSNDIDHNDLTAVSMAWFRG